MANDTTGRASTDDGSASFTAENMAPTERASKALPAIASTSPLVGAKTRSAPGRQGVAYDDVVNAAIKLSNQGITPTLRGVLNELGRGSLTTIQRHLATWYEATGNAEPAQEDSLSQGLQFAVNQEIEQKVIERTARLTLKLHEAEQAREDLVKENERQAQALDDEISRGQGLVQELNVAQGKMSQMSEELYKARGQVEQALMDAAVLQMKLEPLIAEKDAISKELATERTARQAAETKVAVLEARLKDAENQIKGSLAQMSDMLKASLPKAKGTGAGKAAAQ